jgi:Flp pilus assembly protein CpaB
MRLPTFRLRTLLTGVAASALATEFGFHFLRPSVRVTVAARPIRMYEQLDPSNVVIRLYPRISAPTGTMTIRDAGDVYGRFASQPFAAGQPIVEGGLVPRWDGGRRSIIPRGYLAFTAREPVLGTGGVDALASDELVAVLAPADPTSGDYARESWMRLRVIALEQSTGHADRGDWQPSVTLLVTYGQRRRLDAAQRKGPLRMLPLNSAPINQVWVRNLASPRVR